MEHVSDIHTSWVAVNSPYFEFIVAGTASPTPAPHLVCF